MIGYLKGKVKYQGQGFLILDTGNVGYKVFANIRKSANQDAELYIHEHIREDMNDLYGFNDPQEMEFFEILLSVSGVGPKMGLALLTIGSTDKIKQAIIKGDTTLFTTVPGVGKKVAAKIIVELKNKVAARTDSYLPETAGEDSDLVAALEQLGYKQSEIFAAIRELPEELSGTQAKLTWVLQKIKR